MKPSKKIYAKGLGGPYLHIKRALTNSNKRSLKNILEKSILQELEKTFQNQVTIHIEISEGSIKVKIVIGAIALFQFVSNYGSFRSGIDHLVNDVRNLSSTVIEHVIEDENVEQNEIIYKARRLGIPGKIQRFFKKLDRLDDADVNLNQRTVLVDDLKSELTAILSVLEDERDRTLLLEETPNTIRGEIENNIPAIIPGQLDLRYELGRDTMPYYEVPIHEDINRENRNQPPTSLPESYSIRLGLPPGRDEEEE
jgi:hypothetical protein